MSKYTKTETNKSRKKMILIILIVGVIASIFVVSKKPNSNNEPSQEKTASQQREQSKIFEQQMKNDASKAEVSFSSNDNLSGQQKWVANAQQSIQDLNQQQSNTAQQVNQTQNTQSEQQKTIESLNLQMDQLSKVIQDQQTTILNIQAGQTKNQTSTAPDVKPARQVIEIDLDSNNSDNGSPNASGVVSSNKPNNQVVKKDDKVDGDYIPTQTFVKGNLVSSIDANTGGNSNSDPTPLTIMLTDLAQLPNFARKNIKNCFVGVSGFGDLSTERVKMRLTTLSCTLRNGHVIDIPVKGYVVGEDGKAGVKGVVAMHQGSVMAKATLAGFLAGIGNTASNASQTQMVSPVGTTTTINPNQAVGNALGNGASMAFNNLSQYYVNILNQIMPTIEVSSGRNVTVVFTEGITLKEKLGAVLTSDSSSDAPLPFNQTGI